MNIRNPAALGALLSGDMDNFRVASTPGGIEAQEKAGQTSFVAGSTLPKDMYSPDERMYSPDERRNNGQAITRSRLESIGFVFGADIDDLFVSVTMPLGWSKRATEHDMHSEILDEQGRVRIGVFYKAAFYDRKADLNLRCRYGYNTYADGATEMDRRTVITDCGNEIQEIGVRDRDDYKKGDEYKAAAEKWLDNNYPEWKNPLSYW